MYRYGNSEYRVGMGARVVQIVFLDKPGGQPSLSHEMHPLHFHQPPVEASAGRERKAKPPPGVSLEQDSASPAITSEENMLNE